MAKHLLSDRDLRNTKPREKPLYDGEGLRFRPSSLPGHSSAQFKFLRPEDGKPDTLTLGQYPRVTLAEARARAEAARRLVANNKNPKIAAHVNRLKQSADAAAKFGGLAEEWVTAEARRARWSNDYIADVRRSLRIHLSDLAPLPVSEIRATITAPILHRIERDAPGMLAPVKRRLHSIMDYGVETGRIDVNPLPRSRRRAKTQSNHFPSVVTLPDIGAILRAARERPPKSSVERAHVLAVFTAQRIGKEVLGARWDEFELDGVDVPIGDSQRIKFDPNAGNWSIPRPRMKIKDAKRGPHVVPLPPGLLATLREWRAADSARAVYVCPAKNARKPIIPELLARYYRGALKLSGKHSPHSWRAAFKTICSEAGKPADVVEAQLDHISGNAVAAAYDRARRVEARRVLMTWYEAQLVAARDGAAVVPLAGRR